MWAVVPMSWTALVVVAAALVAFVSARVIQPAWWRSRWLRALALVVVAAPLLGLAIWGAGRLGGSYTLDSYGAGIAYTSVIVFVPAALTLPIGAAIDRGLARAAGLGRPALDAAEPRGVAASTRVSRRALVRMAGASLPSALAVRSVSGFVEAQEAPRLRTIPLRFADLPPALHGFKILHLSDLHLGACFGLERLEAALVTARAASPDLVVLTGDLADDVNLVPAALDAIAKIGARHGALASLGNHEYLNGVAGFLEAYAASDVGLLVGDGRTIDVGGARLFVGGSDDPVVVGSDVTDRVAPSIAAAAKAASVAAPPDFRLLLCHRPEGHGPAAEHGFDLVLAGHTHGGQLGIFGRSLFEWLAPGIGWWGSYTRTQPSGRPSRLYTTSGFGHWFPFRAGCPTEMPLIVLERGVSRPPTRASRVGRPGARTKRKNV